MQQFLYRTTVSIIIRTTLGIIIISFLLGANPEILLSGEIAQSLGFETGTSFEGFIGNLLLVYLLFLFLIICTGGIGLIIFIPVSFGVGWVIMTIMMTLINTTKAFLTKNDQHPEPAKSKVQSLTERLNQELRNDPALSRNQSALVYYIKKAREKGLLNHQITQNLTNNGWAMDSIAAAFQMAKNG